MAIKINADGTWAAEYEGPYQGLDVQKPETLISDKASPAFNNFMLRNAELRSRPRLIQFPSTNLNPWVLGVSTFLDANGVYHTVSWFAVNLTQYNPSGPGWATVGTASPGNMQNNPVSYRSFANKIYYTAIGFLSNLHQPVTVTPFVGYWDGISAAPVYQQTQYDASVTNSIAGIATASAPTVGGSLPGAPTLIGPISIGAGFISELNNQLILGNVVIADQGNANKIYTFPNLIWWSANGLPLQWDPTQNTSAGFNPFLDVPDQITGLAMLGIAGYVFRGSGITQMTPTGSAVTPWEFDHMWASEHGIGNVIPGSLAQYGPNAAFVAEDNIYSLSVTNASPIGGTSRDAIMADIASASSNILANIVPIMGNGYVYLTYQIMIPLSSFVRNYVYSFEEQNWSPWDLAIPSSFGFNITGAPNAV